MDERQLIIRAIKAEATLKPKELIILGRRVMTFQEFAEKLNSNDLSKQDKSLVEKWMKSALKMFNENEAFRTRMLNLGGI